MGMYTELRFGAILKKETPKEVIEVIDYLINSSHKNIKPPLDFPFDLGGRITMLVSASTYLSYFDGEGFCDFTKDANGAYTLKIRSTIKDYCGTIAIFLEWIKPHIEKGVGEDGRYAVETYEEQKWGDGHSTVYYSDNTKHENFYLDSDCPIFDFPLEYF